MPDRRVIPLFPLGTLLVPGLVLPLHIFEPRYRRLMADLEGLPDDDRAFGVIAIREGREVGAADLPSLYDVGTLAALREATPLEDGRFDIVTVGTERFRIIDLDESLPYLRAQVEILPEVPGDRAPAAADAVRERFREYRGMFTGEDETDLPDDPRVLSYLVAAAIVIDLPGRQDLLSAESDAIRLRQELAFLRRETALIAALPSLPAVDLVREEISPN